MITEDAMKERIVKRLLSSIIAAALGVASIQFAPAQTFKKVNVKGGAKMVQVAAGAVSVWGLAANGNPYIYKGTQFVLANTISLTKIAVGGGNLRQKDTVWAVDAAGRIYQATKSGTSWVFNQMPGILSSIVVGAGHDDQCHPYEVWGLNPSSEIYRFNYCLKNWEWIPGILTKLAIGGGMVWGMNGDGQVYWFLGSYYNSWQQVPTLSPLADISAGPSGLWGIRLQDNALLQLDENYWQINKNYAPWRQWYTPVTGVWAGGDGVWANLAVGDHSDLMFIPEAIPASGGFLSGPTFVAISAAGAGVWGLDGLGQVWALSAP
jgi:hypothetical protein